VVVLVGDPQLGRVGTLAQEVSVRWPGVRVVVLSVGEVPAEGPRGAVVLAMPCSQRALLRAVAGRGDAAAIVGDLAPRFPGSARILLVDDDPVIQSMVPAMLEAMGLDVVVVGDGGAAVELARTSHFDAILMDVNMPVLDGLAATRALRAMGGPAGRLPILALTASVMPEDVRICLDAGMDAVVAKRMDLGGLFRALEPYLGLADLAGLVGPRPAGTLAPSGHGEVGASEPDDPPGTVALLDRALLGGLADDLGDAGIVAEMLGMFLGELPARLRAIEEALAGREPEAVRRAAHGLASPSATLGLAQLCAACREIERDPTSDLGGQRLERIRQVAQMTRQGIENYRSGLGL
jgi:CheY-like chemotaxis protein